jgi:hypothetical protein
MNTTTAPPSLTSEIHRFFENVASGAPLHLQSQATPTTQKGLFRVMIASCMPKLAQALQLDKFAKIPTTAAEIRSRIGAPPSKDRAPDR